MRLGAVVPYWLERPADEALRVVEGAEAAGLEEVWVGEMLSFDALALAGAAAVATERIPIVVGPLPVTVRTPVGIAMGVASLQQLAGAERVGLALGSSTRPVAAGWHGRDWDRLPGRMEVAVRTIRSVLAGERTEEIGPPASHGFRLGMPASVPEISIAAFGPRMRATASAVGDRLVLNIVTPGLVAELVDEAGGTPVTVWVVGGLEPTMEAMAAVKRQLALYVAAPGYGEMLEEAGFGSLVDAARDGLPTGAVAERMPDALVESVGAVGSLADVEAALDRFESAGADAVALVPMTWDDPAGARIMEGVARRAP